MVTCLWLSIDPALLEAPPSAARSPFARRTPHLPLSFSLPVQLFSALVLVLPPTYSSALEFLGWHSTISRKLAATGFPLLGPVRRVSRGEVGSVLPLRWMAYCTWLALYAYPSPIFLSRLRARSVLPLAQRLSFARLDGLFPPTFLLAIVSLPCSCLPPLMHLIPVLSLPTPVYTNILLPLPFSPRSCSLQSVSSLSKATARHAAHYYLHRLRSAFESRPPSHSSAHS
ncbi:hypothetical protein C8R45DRAFT_1011239 [Mycena sanguinolenta]|nr:hypothetical protein C8R45DRAFT_1011239 [Mycena sanguinolenta]